MPTKSSKSKVSNTTKKTGFKFRWWMALILVAVVAAIGIYVIYTSRASADLKVGTVSVANVSQGYATVNIDGMGPVNFVRYSGNTLNGSTPGWSSDYLGWCASIIKGNSKAGSNAYQIQQGDKVFVTVYHGKNAQTCYGDATVN